MDRLGDNDIKDVWAYHFPRRRESDAARLVLATLVSIVKERSGARTPIDTAAAARRLGIPEYEWNQFESEL